MKRQMTPKERILAAIDHKPIDRIPTDYWGTGEVTQKLMTGLGVNSPMELWKALDMDKIIWAGPAYIGPDLSTGDETMMDYWGVKSRPVTYAGNTGVYYEMYSHPIEKCEAIEEIEACYTWPKADWFDFSKVEEQCLNFADYAIEAGYMAPFYMYTNIRGLEQTLVDLAADEEFADYIIGRICDFLYDYHKRLFEASNGKIDISQVTDDFGTQTGLMISTAMFDRYFKQHYQRLIKLVKNYNIRVFHHDDGAIMPIIPRLVDVGIQILNPIQWHLPGMDLQQLKHSFGKELCFHGGIDNQYVLPFGSADDVKMEVKTCLDILGRDGTGYILAPCHNIQSITPIENIVTMYKTANEYGILCR
ncbi:MAG: hypothetical protein A2Y21_05745 [Clostridiales bacterium GWC2_40_7]|nr:MAG: hypothetical protein A2Y21_05745 [Clostridiales bacterium GWC2_40_7]